MKKPLKTITALISFMIAGSSILIADVVDFQKQSQSKLGKSLFPDSKWIAVKDAQQVHYVDGGITLNDNDKSEHVAIAYNKAFRKFDLPLTTSIDFDLKKVDFNKVSWKAIVLELGFTNGKSDITATFHKRDAGGYLSIEAGDAHILQAMCFEEIGFPWAVEKELSDKLRFTVTLEKGSSNDKFNFCVKLENLKGGDDSSWSFVLKDKVFAEPSSSGKIFALIKSGHSDDRSGMKDRRISRFEVNRKQKFVPADTYVPEGVDFASFILPMKPVKPLVNDDSVWGLIKPRDTSNGLESAKAKPDYCYWDGGIIKDDEGNYHMYASRWGGEYSHHTGWTVQSTATHAVSTNGVLGPYIDKGLIYPDWQNGKGHNIFATKTFDNKYAVVTSEITDGEVFLADKPNGPFKFAGKIEVDLNGHWESIARYSESKRMSNVMIIPRHDGKYMIVPRSAGILISDDNILGPYKVVKDSIFRGMKGVPKACMEDPTCWYSGGMYHMLINFWQMDTTYHFSSIDGINDWKYRGIAYVSGTGMFKYEDGTINNWYCVQRPTVYVEDGHVTHIMFSVIDVHKGQDNGNDTHGSKIIVVPFDGKAFDAAMQKLVEKEAKFSN